jgi:dTDP-glucose pyrophosphorylase
VNPEVAALLVRSRTSVLDAMRQLEDTAHKILMVVDDDEQLLGSLTDGDIRRWILAEGDLQEAVERVCNRTPFQVGPDYDIALVRRTMVEKKIDCIPVVNGARQVVDLLFWDDVFEGEGRTRPARRLDVPAVIMAGGKGTRLDPFTQILPKPLIPLGEKTVIEHIIDHFLKFGVSRFILSVNEKAKIIKSYFEELGPSYAISYVEEDQPLGTAGSLRYLRGVLDRTLIVTNCDVIIDADYGELVDFHHVNSNDITIVGSLKNYHIPYGICEIANGGSLERITEKPEYNFLVNTGMYVLGAQTLGLIPEGVVFHMTDLIGCVQKSGGKVAVFPVSDKAWIDTGEWAEYRKALRELRVDYD